MLVTFTELGETGDIKWIWYEMKNSVFVTEFGKNNFDEMVKADILKSVQDRMQHEILQVHVNKNQSLVIKLVLHVQSMYNIHDFI